MVNEDEEEDDSRYIVLQAQIQTHLQDENSPFSVFHKKMEQLQIPHCKTISFCLFLFQQQILKNIDKQFYLKLFYIYYLTKLRISVFTINSLFIQLRQQSQSLPRAVSLISMTREINVKLKDYNEGTISFQNQFKTAYDQPLEVHNILSNGEQKMQMKPLKAVANFNMMFDALRAHEDLVNLMNKAIDQVIKIYDLSDSRELTNSQIHQRCTKIAKLKDEVHQAFTKIESQGVPNYRFHLLPYGLFQDAIDNDRPTLIKMIKLHKEKVLMSLSHLRKFNNQSEIKAISARQAIIFLVSGSPDNFGKIIETSKNLMPSFGVDFTRLSEMTVSDLVSEEFKQEHQASMKHLSLMHDRPYFGLTKVRYARIISQEVYSKVSVVTKLFPRVESSINFMCLMKKEQKTDSYLVISSKGIIVGYSQEILQHLPSIQHMVGQSLNYLSEDLLGVFSAQLFDQICSSNKLNHAVIAQYMKESGLSQEMFERYRQPEVMDNLRISNQYNGYSDSRGTGNSLVRVHNFWVDPIICNFENRVFVEGVFHLQFSSSQHKKMVKTQSKIELMTVESSLQNQSQNQQQPQSKFSLANSKENATNQVEYHKKTMKQNMTTLGIGASLKPYGKNIRGAISITSNLDKMNTKDLVDHARFGSQSSGSVKEDHSIQSRGAKSKINQAISKQKRQFVWKETTGIIIVQIVVWSMCIYITTLLDKNFYKEMKDIISLRKGILLFTLANSHSWNCATLLFDRMLSSAGLVDPQRMRMVVPNYTQNFTEVIEYNYLAAQNYSHSFNRHVYSFPMEYACRYLVNKVNFTNQVSDFNP